MSSELSSVSSRGGDVALPAGKLGAEGCKSGNKSSSGKTGRYFRKKGAINIEKQRTWSRVVNGANLGKSSPLLLCAIPKPEWLNFFPCSCFQDFLKKKNRIFSTFLFAFGLCTTFEQFDKNL